MEFRPCIDIHNGKVKQIVGGAGCRLFCKAVSERRNQRRAYYSFESGEQ